MLQLVSYRFLPQNGTLIVKVAGGPNSRSPKDAILTRVPFPRATAAEESKTMRFRLFIILCFLAVAESLLAQEPVATASRRKPVSHVEGKKLIRVGSELSASCSLPRPLPMPTYRAKSSCGSRRAWTDSCSR